MNKINYLFMTNILGQWMRLLWCSLFDDCARQKPNLCPCCGQNLKTTGIGIRIGIRIKMGIGN